MENIKEKVLSYLPDVYKGISGLSHAGIGAGLGLLIRSKFDEKFKEDPTLKDKLVARAPLLGALTGLIFGIRHARLPESMFMHGFKTAALKKNVALRPHQERAIDKIVANDGSLLVAHATGSGKTLTGIAAFEELKKSGKATRALVVVPAALRENFVSNGIKRFTDSSVSVYGPKGESSTKDIGQKANSDYNVVSYELFREHGEKLIEDTGADTLIMDEIHRVRGTEGVTYNKIRELRQKFKNAITLTGSIVNNEPNEVVPLLDVTFNPTGHKLISKDFFDKTFVRKDAKTYGFFNPKVTVEKTLKNKDKLSDYIRQKVDFVSHQSIEKELPKKNLQTIKVQMSPEQTKLYEFTLSSVDPITRWKIRNNIPVGQREAQEAFGKLMQARQVSTDPAVLDKRFSDRNPYDYSPKVKAVVDDLKDHLEKDKQHKSVIYGNLIHGQLGAIEKALKEKNIPFARFYGLGQEGSSSKVRQENVKDFMAGKRKVLLISGAGSEGLDLKNTTMIQMLEGHYNPEKIHQAESRVRRLGSDIPEVQVRRYITQPKKPGIVGALLRRAGLDAGHGIDEWIYNIAEKKDRLNSAFRDVLEKKASYEEDLKKILYEINARNEASKVFVTEYMSHVGRLLGGIPGALLAIPVKKRVDKKIEERLKQELLDRGHEDLTTKRHYNKILAKSKIDERFIDATLGTTILASSIPAAMHFHPKLKAKFDSGFYSAFSKAAPKRLLEKMTKNPVMKATLPALVTGGLMGLTEPSLIQYIKGVVTANAVGTGNDLDIGIKKYIEELRKKTERKYKSSKGFVQEYDTKKELGIDTLKV